MLLELYRMMYENEKSFFSKNSLNVPNVKLFSIFWPRFYIGVLGMTFFFHYVHLLFPIFIWTFISLFSLDFYFPFFFGLLFSLFSLDFYFPFLFGLLFPFFLWTFIQSRSHFGFLPNFFQRFNFFIHFCWEWHLALCILSDFPGIRNLSGLNDLNSLNNLSGLNDLYSLISSKKLLSLMFPSTLPPN